LIALAYLADRPGRVAPAREIAGAYNLPVALLMNILKSLHQHDVLRSTRGTKGGYQINIALDDMSLLQLIEVVEGPVYMTECIRLAQPVLEGEPAHDPIHCKVHETCPIQSPIQALHHRLVRFLDDVKLSHLLTPGKRIDVPVELVGMG